MKETLSLGTQTFYNGHKHAYLLLCRVILPLPCWTLSKHTLKGDFFIILNSKQTCLLLWRETITLSSKAAHYINLLEKYSLEKRQSVASLLVKHTRHVRDPWRTVFQQQPCLANITRRKASLTSESYVYHKNTSCRQESSLSKARPGVREK